MLTSLDINFIRNNMDHYCDEATFGNVLSLKVVKPAFREIFSLCSRVFHTSQTSNEKFLLRLNFKANHLHWLSSVACAANALGGRSFNLLVMDMSASSACVSCMSIAQVLLTQGFPTWGTCIPRGAFACLKGTFEVSNRREKIFTIYF